MSPCQRTGVGRVRFVGWSCSGILDGVQGMLLYDEANMAAATLVSAIWHFWQAGRRGFCVAEERRHAVTSRERAAVVLVLSIFRYGNPANI
jgi:hypothetical protein